MKHALALAKLCLIVDKTVSVVNCNALACGDGEIVLKDRAAATNGCIDVGKILTKLKYLGVYVGIGSSDELFGVTSVSNHAL